MISQIQDTIKDIDHHLDNIKELVPGLSDNIAEDVLMAVLTASSSLEEAHSLMLDIIDDRPPWET